MPELDESVPPQPLEVKDETFAKQQLGKPALNQVYLAMVGTNSKMRCMYAWCFLIKKVPATKRGVLNKLARLYDPLGLVSLNVGRKDNLQECLRFKVTMGCQVD